MGQPKPARALAVFARLLLPGRASRGAKPCAHARRHALTSLTRSCLLLTAPPAPAPAHACPHLERRDRVLL